MGRAGSLGGGVRQMWGAEPCPQRPSDLALGATAAHRAWRCGRGRWQGGTGAYTGGQGPSSSVERPRAAFQAGDNGVERPVCRELGVGVVGTGDDKACEPLRAAVSASIVQWRTVDYGYSLRGSTAMQGRRRAGEWGVAGWGFQSEPS